MRITTGVRKLFFFLMYTSLWLLSLLFSFYIVNLKLEFFTYTTVFLTLFISRLFLMNVFHLFDISWRFVSIKEVLDLVLSIFLSEIPAIFFIYFIMKIPGIRLIIVEFLFSTTLSLALIVSKRVYLMFRSELQNTTERRKAIILGDTSRIEKFLRAIENSPFPFLISGIIATDDARKGAFIRGIQIIGNYNDLIHIVRNRIYDAIYVIGNSINRGELRRIIRECERYNIKLRIISIDIAYKNSSIFTIRDIEVEDLLFRGEVKIEPEIIERFINHKCVLITGAGGSIGRELSYQVARFTPLKLLLLDIDETNVFLLVEKLKQQFPYVDIEYYVADVSNERKIERIFGNNRIDVVFHAAAYKHVPVMERFPDEAARVNIIGTYTVAKVAANSHVSRFILISTDKAVNPTSIMGATKRIAERIVISMAKDYSKTFFVVVRFGNVLGSRGSVIPIFNEQIRQGGPITITHPDMERYFMTTKEAVLLVLEAGSIGQSGEIYVLDMGKPVKIIELAKELIRLNGLEPEVDIKIRFVGRRPGEKLTEVLYSKEENLSKTELEKVLRLKPNGTYEFNYKNLILDLQVALTNYNEDKLKRIIWSSI